ncbi:DUF4396 domain-containing protein [Acetobacteraceae bacterium KSS8]|uniref:DUF4396 domain-containing protein n=1 Tax=Endosaccharibacter trunci TaxID=2812733 RepID=A0ABT1W5H7_9PROT|nr:DUF4396 domain-containing protein [Acetobacteraceae bacterium KSS8]
MIPPWLHTASLVSLGLGAVCAVLLLVDCLRRPPHMAIMILVWPICCLFGSLAVVWLYWTHGRAPAPSDHGDHEHQHHHHHHGSGSPKTGFASVATDTLHCGSGCTLGDVCGETLLLFVPQIAVWIGFPALSCDRMFAGWIVDTVFAYGFGILFQFFAIAPMRGLGLRDGLVAAIKADTLSLLSWQAGMFAFMAFAHYVLFERLLGTRVSADSPVFWFAMQAAMLCGFATAFPMNRWLIGVGLKDGM